MRTASRLLASLTLFTVIAISSDAGSIESDPIVAKVGARSLPLSTLADRLEMLPAFQRQALGVTPYEQGKHYLERVLIRDLLLAEQGRTHDKVPSPTQHARENALLRRAFVARLQQLVDEQTKVTDDEVRNYYDAHPELFVTKERLRLQRLLVASEREATELIAKAKTLPTMDDWRNLVRQKSLDKATSERGGELGFVADDGSTELPELEVDRALFAAAKHAKDGELVATPVAEGKRFAVLWRRGSRPAKSVDFNQESAQIRRHLFEARVEQRLAETLRQLRESKLRDYRPELLETQDFNRLIERGFPQTASPANASRPSPPAQPK